MRSVLRRLRTSISIVALLVAAACASGPPAPLERDRRIDLTAAIESIDYETRMVVLRAVDGRRAVIQAGPEVRNLDQVRIGDRVLVSYYEGLAVGVTSPQNATLGVEQDIAVSRSRAGGRPAGALGETLTTTVTIESVDTSFNTVTFKRADGVERMIPVEDPDAQKFIRGLKRGDLVQIRYMEAIAVSLQPQA